MELSDRIKHILENNKVKPGISEYEFAKSVETYPAKFAEIRSGKVKTLSTDIALKISKLYGYEFKWILTGEGRMFLERVPTGELSKVSLESKLEGWDENIANFMADKGLTAEEFSAKTGISYERLVRMPFVKKQLPECEDFIGMLNFDVSLDEIFLNKSAENPTIEAEIAELEARARELKGKLR